VRRSRSSGAAADSAAARLAEATVRAGERLAAGGLMGVFWWRSGAAVAY
jgi:hypothetical protein